MEEAQDYYELLGVSPQAVSEQIHHAYETAMQRYESDMLGGYSLISEKEKNSMLCQINAAYVTLSDASSRQAYDWQRDFQNSHPAFFERVKRAWQKAPASTASGSEKNTHASESEAFSEDATSDLLRDMVEERKVNYQRLNEKNKKTRERVATFLDNVDSFSGDVLRQIRIKKQVNIEELSTATCVRKNFLEALEEEKFECFPKAAFLRGYLQSYARALSLPVMQITIDYMRQYDDWMAHSPV